MLLPLEVNGGRVEREGDHILLRLPPTPRGYANAQLDNYHGLRRNQLPARPPTSFRLHARASHPQPLGTLGFGFWNDPFSLNGGVLAAPNCVWFFYASPPADMALVDGVPGWGWKAATLNSGNPHPLLLAPAALAAIALTNIPGLGRPIMTAARKMIRAQEALLADVDLTQWHTYELEWENECATLRVDGVERLSAPHAPTMPLGFVLWIDNQYAIALREGQFKFGVCPTTEEQWLEVVMEEGEF